MMMEGLAAESAEPKTLMIDATYLKAYRTSTSASEGEGGYLADCHDRVRRSGYLLPYFLIVGGCGDERRSIRPAIDPRAEQYRSVGDDEQEERASPEYR